MRIDGGVCENQKRKPMYFSENEAKHTLYSLGFIRKGERERKEERKKGLKEEKELLPRIWRNESLSAIVGI